MRFGVVIFPGSNCDQDIIHVLRDVMGCEVLELWHRTLIWGLTTNDCVVLPGGFFIWRCTAHRCHCTLFSHYAGCDRTL